MAHIRTQRVQNAQDRKKNEVKCYREEEKGWMDQPLHEKYYSVEKN
jgi:hypothetical protein